MRSFPRHAPSGFSRVASSTGPRRGDGGFTLFEMLISAGLIALMLAGAASMLSVANRSSARQGGLSQLDALIDQDLAAIQALDRRLSCCAGSPCTLTIPSGSSTCGDPSGAAVSPGNENYYSPRRNIDPTDPQKSRWSVFKEACENGGIATALQENLAPAPTPPSPLALNRTVTRADQESNRLQILYTGTNSGTTVTRRAVSLVPTAANWCP